MAKARGNPFTGDGRLDRRAFDKGLDGARDTVKVLEHTRRKPLKRAHPSKLQPGGPEAEVREADNLFDDTGQNPMGEQSRSGLQRPGDKQVNHLKGAIGLLNARRA